MEYRHFEASFLVIFPDRVEIVVANSSPLRIESVHAVERGKGEAELLDNDTLILKKGLLKKFPLQVVAGYESSMNLVGETKRAIQEINEVLQADDSRRFWLARFIRRKFPEFLTHESEKLKTDSPRKPYWEFLDWIFSEQLDFKPSDSDRTDQLCRARDYFQKSVIHLKAGKRDTAFKHLVDSRDSYLSVSSVSWQPTDHVIFNTLNWLLGDGEKMKYFLKPYFTYYQKIKSAILRANVRDLFWICKRRNFLYFDSYVEEERENMEKTSQSPSFYEQTADYLVKFAQLCFVFGDLRSSFQASRSARKLYNKAFRKLKNTQMNLQADNLGALDNIQLFSKQAEIIESLSESLIKRDLEKFIKSYQKVDSFLLENLPIREGENSTLGFIEELEWALIKRKIVFQLLNVDFSGSSMDVLEVCFI